MWIDERRSRKASLLLSDESDSDESMTDALQLPHAPPPFAYEDASVSTLYWETQQSEACTVQHTAAAGAVAASAALSAALHAKRCAADVEYAPLTAWTNKAPRQSSTSAPLSPSVSWSVPLVLGKHHAIVAPGIASTAPSVPVALLQGLNSHSVSVSPAAASIAPSVSDAVVLEPGSHSVAVAPGIVLAAPSVPAAHPQRGYDAQLSHDTLGDKDCTDFDRAFILQFLPSCYNEHADYGGVLHVCSACEHYFSKAIGVSHPAHYGATARDGFTLRNSSLCCGA
jgi:hypothetical protein